LGEANLIMEIDQKNFSIMLYENMLKVEPKKSILHKLEEALENKPVLKDTFGEILHIFAPLHIRLSQIDKASVDKKGNVRIVVPQHRDVTLPLSLEESKKLVNRLNQLIPKAKEKEKERRIAEKKLQVDAEEEEEMARTPLVSGMSQMPPTEGVFEAETEAHRHTEREESEHDH